MAGRLLGIDLRGAGHKKVKTTPHLDTVKDADLSTLAALEATGEKLFFASGPWWPKKTFFQFEHRRLWAIED
jgi:hypothetical protein